MRKISMFVLNAEGIGRAGARAADERGGAEAADGALLSEAGGGEGVQAACLVACLCSCDYSSSSSYIHPVLCDVCDRVRWACALCALRS